MDEISKLTKSELGELEAEDFTPDPISMLESNRNLGYSIEEAVSDLIDNAITAKATEIVYEIHWNNGTPFFLLKDNGHGMSNDTLINSFKLGSKNPLENRDPHDLGRFGFGMKTASLSQARILTVITKKNGSNTIYRSLDLNFMARLNQGWKLKKVAEELITSELLYLDQHESGTIIKWSDWDRAPKDNDEFTDLVEVINSYIRVCFHRFIEDKGIKLFCHETEIKPCGPIPSGEGSEQFSSIALSQNQRARQTAFILQHPQKWEEDYEAISRFNSFRLFKGFERQQGIYIYRCDRLLTPRGGWLGLLRKGNSAKLARVVIDYPNDADSLWSLDITKTNASIPYQFKKEIKKLIDAARRASITKIVRGNRSIKKSLTPGRNAHIWKVSIDKEFNSYRYLVDLEHPLFSNLIKEKVISLAGLQLIATVISDNLPVATIIQNNDEDPSKHDRISKKEKLNKQELQLVKKIFQYQCGQMTKAAAFSWLLSFEPYCYHEDQLNKYLNE